MRALALLVIASLAVGAQAQEPAAGPSAPTTLYFHLDANQDFPINTQPPDDRFARDTSLGLLAPTTSCVPTNGTPAGATSKAFHTLYGYSTPGFVEYDVQEEGGPRLHNERGLAADLFIDASHEATLHWYLTTEAVGGADIGPDPDTLNNLPVVLPQVVVEATVRTGDDVGIGAEAYNSGTMIAAGLSAPQDLYPGSANHVALADGTNMYAFQVPITVVQEKVPAAEAYNVRIDVRMDVPGCDSNEAALMPSLINVHTSAEYRPRMDLSVRNPLWVAYNHPQFVDRDLYVHMGFNSPWGNYDIATDDLAASVAGPSQPNELVRVAVVQRTHEHNHHFEPVDVTYAWYNAKSQMAEGTYAFCIDVTNLQGTAAAESCVPIVVDGDTFTAFDADGNEVPSLSSGGEKDAPGVGLWAMAAALAVAVARRR